MIDQQSIIVVRPTFGDDLLCLQRGERAGDLFKVNQVNPLAPSGQWRLTALVQPWGWGYRQHYTLAEIADLELDRTTDWKRGDFCTYKNGNPRFTVRDIDHGTSRQWGTPSLRKLSRWPVQSVLDDLSWRRRNAQRMNQPAVDNVLAAIERHLEAHA